MIDHYSDENLCPYRTAIKKKFEQIAIQKQDNILLAMRERERTGYCSPDYLKKLSCAIIHERRTREIALYTKWRAQKLKEICTSRGVNLKEACSIFVNEHGLS